MIVGDAGLILYLDTKFPDPFYADIFVVLLTAIDGKQEVGDRAGKYLDHKKLCESLKISFIMKMRPKHL